MGKADTAHYTVNGRRAISETLDGETIIINLESGNYYSLNSTGSEAWNFLLSGVSIQQLVYYFLQTTNGTEDIIKKSVDSFIGLLRSDDLVEEKESGAFSFSPVESKKPFQPLQAQKYEDMQEMLLADPIHDVDTAGWPTLKQQ